MILVVDDDTDLREMVRTVLEDRGHPVVEASNGEQALEVLSHEHPCLVILDLVMPLMSGADMLARMKERGITDVPVCVVSALPERAPEGAVCTLPKPFAVKELLALAARYCRHSS